MNPYKIMFLCFSCVFQLFSFVTTCHYCSSFKSGRPRHVLFYVRDYSKKQFNPIESTSKLVGPGTKTSPYRITKNKNQLERFDSN